MSVDPADIDVTTLNDAQLDGRACVRCGGQDCQPMIPLHSIIVGLTLFVHAGDYKTQERPE